MSDADRVGLAFVEETTYGETPTGPAPTLQELRFTGESLNQNTDSISSAEIRDDRQVPDVIRTGISAQGGIDLEMSYDAYDEFLAAALHSAAWSSLATDTQTTFSMAVSDNSVNDSGSGFVTAGFLANQWVEIRGFTTAANNGYFKIVSVVAGKMVLSGGIVEDEAVGDSVTILMGPQILNGTTLTSYSIERVYTDVASEFAIYTGMAIDTFSVAIAVQAIITGSFAFLGVKEDSATATAGDGSNTAATTKEIMNCVDNVIAILENQASFAVTGVNFELSNNLRARLQVATLGPISLGSGKVAITGGMQAYFTSKVLMDKYLDSTETSLALVVEDDAGNAYIIDFPKVKLTTGTRNAGGENTDVMTDIGFVAYMHPVELITVRIAKFAA